jgi:L-malate glycosyltransferase
MTDSLRIGGSERQFALLARAFELGAFQLRLGCIQRTGGFLEGLGEIQEFNLGGSFLSWRAQRTRAALWRFLRHNHVAVAQSFDFYSNLLLIPAARLARVPVVVGSQRQLGDLLRPMQGRVQNLVFHWADCVVCNSQMAARLLAAEGIPCAKLSVIHNGLDAEAFAVTAPALPPEPGVMRVGMIARMNDRAKNHALFLRAAARIANRFPGAEFVLVGDGPFRKDWEELAQKLGIAARTRFLGDRRDIPSVLAALDVVASPSRSESLSNSIIEAMAAGRPVVASAVGGNPELVRDRVTGLLVPPGDEVAFAQALEILLASPNLAREWGENACRVARNCFTIERAREQFEQLYLELLAKKGWRPAATGPALRPRSGGTHAWPL